MLSLKGFASFFLNIKIFSPLLFRSSPTLQILVYTIKETNFRERKKSNLNIAEPRNHFFLYNNFFRRTSTEKIFFFKKCEHFYVTKEFFYISLKLTVLVKKYRMK